MIDIKVMTPSTHFDANSDSRLLSVFKYRNCLHKLCVTASAAAASAGRFDKKPNQSTFLK